MDSFENAWFDCRFELLYERKKGNEFQDFFCDIMESAYPSGDFVRTRPWGRQGDRKNDGYLGSKRTLFQVYAPDDMSESNAKSKIREDFEGALPYWSTHFEQWTLVHNARKGLSPGVTQLLLELSCRDDGKQLNQWGYNELWKEFLLLDRSQKARIVGNPPIDLSAQTLVKQLLDANLLRGSIANTSIFHPLRAPSCRNKEKIPCLRISLEKDPHSSSFILIFASMLEPVLPEQMAILQQSFGRRMEPKSIFPCLMSMVLNPLKQLVKQALPDTEAEVWRNVVLQIEVNPEYAFFDFETATRDWLPNSPMSNFFRSITIRPSIYGREIAQLEKPISHPSRDLNSRAEWSETCRDKLYTSMIGRDCLVGGPFLLSRAENGLAIAVAAFDGYPCAIILDEESEELGLESLFDSKSECHWEELLDRVTQLRATGAKVKVLWDDAQYDPPMACSL